MTLRAADTGTVLRILGGHQGRISGFAFSPDSGRLATSSWDSTVKIWALDKPAGSALVTLYSSRLGPDHWLAMTEYGFFNAGSHGDQLLSIVHGVEAFGVNQAYQSLFNPDLVREALSGDPNEEAHLAAGVLDLDKVFAAGSPPTVSIQPLLSTQSTREEITLQAAITDNGGGIGRMEWRVNGVTVSVSPASGEGKDRKISQSILLEPGENRIELIAYNARHTLASDPSTVVANWTPAGDAPLPALHVLAVGINAYHDRGWKPEGQHVTYAFPRLTLAVNDATAFGESFKQAASGLYAEVHITTLADSAATREGLHKAIDKIAAEVNSRDTFILFVAAHGKSEAGRFYLIPQDYDGGPNPEALATRAVDQFMLQDWLANRIKARKALILLDTCESGALIGGHRRSRTDQPSSEASLGRLHEATGRPVLTAAAEGKPAFEGYQGHGVFTWSLLDALANGDRNGNGNIELSELVAHVQDQVPKIAAKLKGRGLTVIAARGSIGSSQSARFGSRGEDFVLAHRLQ